MEYNKEKNYPLDKQPADTYDDGDIPQVDLPQDSLMDSAPMQRLPKEMATPVFPMEMPMDIIPDEVPRKDGPGGDDGEIYEL